MIYKLNCIFNSTSLREDLRNSKQIQIIECFIFVDEEERSVKCFKTAILCGNFSFFKEKIKIVNVNYPLLKKIKIKFSEKDLDDKKNTDLTDFCQ